MQNYKETSLNIDQIYPQNRSTPHTLDSKSLSVVEILRNIIMNATLNNLSPYKYIFVLAWKFAGNYKMKKSSHSKFPFAPRKYWTN